MSQSIPSVACRWHRRGLSAVETLIGLLVVVLIAGWAIKRFGQHQEKDPTRRDIAMLEAALNQYWADNGRAPTTQQGLQALLQRPTIDPQPRKWRKYLELNTIPKDRWGRDFYYQAPGPQGESYFVASLGADGKRGGKGEDKDITSTEVSSGG